MGSKTNRSADGDAAERVVAVRRLTRGVQGLVAVGVLLGLSWVIRALSEWAWVVWIDALLLVAAFGCLAVIIGATETIKRAGQRAGGTPADDRAADMGQFVATLSHELRTPLSVILGYTDLILESVFGQPSADEVRALHRIRHQSMQLLDLMQGILDLNRLEARGLALSLQDTTVRQVMLSVQESIPDAWARPGVRLEWKGLESQSVLYSDRGKIEMILRNLIHNALKYTERGSVCVSAATPANDHTVEFVIADTGMGISKEDLTTVFDMYAQGRSGPRGGGVGLGLFIVKRLTEALGGTVGVESQEGVGTRFKVTLPCELHPRSVAA
ncbi:MAG: hypothetical protein HY270_22655 [Deltaproteobacteria bacterium]|nr:hypothetical protein [Deltaproteobacteria bacterium]